MNKTYSFAALLVVSLTLQACLVRGIVYSNLDWFAMRVVNSYVSLSDEQEQKYEPKIREWINGSKKKTLSIIKTKLDDISTRSQSDEKISREDLNELIGTFLDARSQFLLNGSSLLASFFKALTPEQISSFSEKMAEWEVEYTTIITADPEDYEELIEERIDKIEDRMEDWVGSFSKEQRELVRKYWWKDRSFIMQRLLNRKQLQVAFFQQVLEQDEAQLEAFFIEWAKDYRHLNKLTFTKKEDDLFQVEEFFDRFLASLSEKQHQILKKQIKSLADDLSGII